MVSVSGLEFMEGVRDGRFSAAPIARFAQMRLLEVSEGQVIFEGTPAFEHYNPIGSVHGGWFGILLDSALGCAVMTRLARGQIYTTLEYKVNILRPAFEHTDPLRATADVVHFGRRTASAEARLEAADGKLYATGTTTCLVMEGPGT